MSIFSRRRPGQREFTRRHIGRRDANDALNVDVISDGDASDVNEDIDVDDAFHDELPVSFGEMMDAIEMMNSSDDADGDAGSDDAVGTGCDDTSETQQDAVYAASDGDDISCPNDASDADTGCDTASDGGDINVSDDSMDGGQIIYRTNMSGNQPDVERRGNKTINRELVMDVRDGYSERTEANGSDAVELFAIGVMLGSTIHGYVFTKEGRLLRSAEEPGIAVPENWCKYYLGVFDGGEHGAFDAMFRDTGYTMEWLGVFDGNDGAVDKMRSCGIDCSKMDLWLDDENTDFI